VTDGLSPGDAWLEHYRGLTLHLNSEGEIWWRPYSGEQRLFLEDPAEQLVQQLLEVKPTGAMFRVTEHNDVIAKVENDEEGTYDPVFVGRLEEASRLLPGGSSEYPVELHPTGLKEGDLWPSVYDGARYSLTDPDTIWWHNPDSKRRYPVEDGIPADIARATTFHKNGGGSFRVTPWGDVITLIEAVPEPEDVIEQYRSLPRPIQNIIQLRNDRGGDMLPIYVGNIGDNEIRIEDPQDLTDALGSDAQEEIKDWIRSLGPTSASRSETTDNRDTAGFNDDPDEWATDVVERDVNKE
jgi:hypothetical protein